MASTIALSFPTLLAPVHAAAPANPRTTIMALSWVRDCSSTNDTICPAFDTLYAGTTVQMQCYKNDSAWTGRWASNLWFLVSVSDGPSQGVIGYVHSSYVSWPQPVVGPCDNLATERAVLWAVNGIGTQGIPCDDRRVCPGYYGWCLQFMADSYRYGAGINIGSAGSAALWWQAAGSRQKANWNAPRGSLVFWETGTYGHVAMSLGGGRAVSTWVGKNSKIHVITKLGGIGLKYIGWVGIA